MGILGKDEILVLFEKGILFIESIDPDSPFIPEKQVTEDTIDLRLGISGLVYKENIEKIDSIYEPYLNECFEKVDIPVTGYELKPGQVLFTSTLEIIGLATSKYSGKVYGRSTFSRYGISIHCTQPKCPPGLSWTFPLQLVNNNSMPIIIYPYCYIAQLQIEKTSSKPIEYEGKYDRTIVIGPPKIDKREIEPLKNSSSIRATKEILNETLKKIDEKIEEFEQEEVILEDTLLQKIHKNKKLLNVILTILNGIFIGITINIFTTPINDYWKNAAGYLSFIISITLMFIEIFIIFSINGESENE